MRRAHILSAIGIFVAAILGVGTYGGSSSSSSSNTNSVQPSAPSKPLTVDLNASISFTGTQFIISNNDSFDWTNVKLEINSGLISSGFILRTERIKAGETYSVGAAQFAKPDGMRFNPLEYKPQKLTVWCDTPNGDGFYYGTWN